MMLKDEAKLLSVREAFFYDELKNGRPDVVGGAPSLLARTKVLNTYPSVSQCYYACEPLFLLGTEVENGPGLISGTSTTFFALNLGSVIPPVGTQIIAAFVGNRWVFRYDA
jgi:hypothetical protein